MTENTTGGTARAPELRIASGLLQGFREDLVTDAFAYRPLPPIRPEGRWVRWLPRGLRPRAGYLPHVLVGFLALLALLVSLSPVSRGVPAGLDLVVGLMAATPVLMTLVRPVGAFWAVVGVTMPLSLAHDAGLNWPWMPGTFVAHLAVVTVVAIRSRPRVAGWMWLITVLVGSVLPVLVGRAPEFGPMAFLTALSLLAVTVRTTRRQAREEVTAQREVTAVERDRRTLLEERTTIARELHDVVAHHMSVVAIQAEAAPYRVKNPPAELEAAFVTIRENAVAALTELRRVLGVVRSADDAAPDAPQPTLASLDGLLANVREAGLQVDKTVTGAVRELPQGVELSAYRIVQEALSNTLRHAPGAAAGVELSYVLGGLGVRVVNGPATGEVPPSPGAGHGITGMRERVAMLEGEMTAGSTASGGYEVAVFLPVPSRPERPAEGEPA
ncbi:sensor histidine kinase [Streptomyces sp. cmx-4-9]|uniref:sensor histidine kinase n=1 Tax=Streptomyces sp. cmx-4-9 TaxID=2790941 RepID=UPI00397EE158